MTPVHPALCTAKLPLGTVTTLDCFLPAGHEETGDRPHWDAVDGVRWMSEEEYDAFSS